MTRNNQYFFKDQSPSYHEQFLHLNNDNSYQELQSISSQIHQFGNKSFIDIQQDINICNTINNNIRNQDKKNRKQYRKRKQNKRGIRKKINGSKLQSDYKKNICGYIVKKVMRQFTNITYQKQVQQICELQNIQYKYTRNFYQPKIQRVTGPSHIPGLFHISKQSDSAVVKVFSIFFKWFLKQRYVRHLFMEGKMVQKRAYIQYKNKVLLPMIYQIEKQLGQDIQPATSIVNQISQFHLQITE